MALSKASDALACATAYRIARDEDVMNAMNVQSSRRENDLRTLAFCVVPGPWMRKAWPVLNSPHTAADGWKEEIGRIDPSHLYEPEKKAISSDEEEEDPKSRNPMFAELHKRTEKTRRAERRPRRMRRDLVHEDDFFLVGSAAWETLKQEFGADDQIRLKTVFLQTANSQIAVELFAEGDGLERLLLSLPGSGRFAYESVLNKHAHNNQGNNKRHPGNVSDDDETADCREERPNSPEDDDRMSTDQQNASQQPVVLLPASTTSHSYTKASHVPSDGSQIVHAIGQRKPYGSGLGNLGNTCFMNSTLQCLAHTDPLRKYFLSGEYVRDLNRDNPLGTGGDLAVQFAQLLGEMWGSQGRSNNCYGSSTGVVYPRDFKFALGRHAEQFVGYDQHDSQELATYLLDALHEDTNRVTKKPYVEKPEQGENETDEEAANKAWDLHLKREDSKVLEYFMGQVKSRVQCCVADCGRVSTTFDPFMYLSVPIPGSSERTMRVTYVPLDPAKRSQEIMVTISKTAKLNDLFVKVVEEIRKFQLIEQMESVAEDDLMLVDVWRKDVYKIYKLTEDVDIIRDTDETFAYQLRPLREVRDVEEESAKRGSGDVESGTVGMRERSTPKRYKLDLATLTRVNGGVEWTNEMAKYLRQEMAFHSAFNPRRGKVADRVKQYNNLHTFIELCYQDADPDFAGQKRSREDSSEAGQISVSPDEDEIPAIRERCESSLHFKDVKRRHDVAILEFLAGRMRKEIIQMEACQKDLFPNGICVQVYMKKSVIGSVTKEQNIAVPFVLRIPSNTTVYGLRQQLACRLSRSLKVGGISPGEASCERQVIRDMPDAALGSSNFGSPDLLVVRQIPLTYERKTSNQFHRSTVGPAKKLGALEKSGQLHDGTRPVSLASPTDDEERAVIAEIVGDLGVVNMEWPEDLAKRVLDVGEYEAVDTPTSPDVNDASGRGRKAPDTVSVLDCISKYCQQEQLEETEMWYCNRCKEHVRAWKQFYIYRSPPILIIHLKRFQYSATTHRRDKIGLFIDFPLEGLDLTKEVMHWTEEDKPIYDCYAVSNHYGGLGGGHYTAHALNDNGSWCYYDDSRITTDVDPKEAVSQAAYVLYYRRRDVPIGEDFAMNLTTPGAHAPAIIRDTFEKVAEPSSDEISSTNVAMVDGEDGMDVDGTEFPSRSTSPMGSMDGNPDRFTPQNFGDARDTFDDRLPSQ